MCNKCSSLFACSSIMCVSPGSIFIVWFFLLIMDHIFQVLCMPYDFRSDARHCEFYLAVCWIFCLTKNIFELCSEMVIMPWNYLIPLCVAGTIYWVFLNHCLLRTNNSPLLRQDLLGTLPDSPWMRFSLCFMGTGSIPGPVWALGWVVLSPAIESVLICMQWSILSWILERHLL